MNSQMFFDISSRQIKHLHLYATWFIDEMSVSRFTKDDEWNFFSYKAGFRLNRSAGFKSLTHHRIYLYLSSYLSSMMCPQPLFRMPGITLDII